MAMLMPGTHCLVFHVRGSCVTEMALLLLLDCWISFHHKLISDLFVLLKFHYLHMQLQKKNKDIMYAAMMFDITIVCL